MITSKEIAYTIAELKAIPVVKAERFSDRWKGIQHGELVESIHDVLDRKEIQVTDERWYPTGKDFQRLNGSMDVKIKGLEPMEGTQFSLGVMHSNLGDHAMKFASGAHVFCCANGVVTGDFVVKRKHTSGLDLGEAIELGVDQYLNKIAEVKIVAEKMRATELVDDDVVHALMSAGREGLLSWSRIGQVDKEYSKPTFAEHDEKTAWGLYNAFTYTIQKMPPQYHIKGMNRFREILVDGVAA